MLTSTVIAALNHLLTDAPWARDRLKPFAGRTAVIQVAPASLCVAVEGDGFFTDSATADTPDVRLELPVSSLPKAVGGMDALMGDIRITGNADFADALGFVLRHLRWDGEEVLAKRVGDIAAHRAINGVRDATRWHLDAARNLTENFVEYFTEERPLILARPQFDPFATEMAALRDDLARLDKRLSRLEAARR